MWPSKGCSSNYVVYDVACASDSMARSALAGWSKQVVGQAGGCVELDACMELQLSE